MGLATAQENHKIPTSLLSRLSFGLALSGIAAGVVFIFSNDVYINSLFKNTRAGVMAKWSGILCGYLCLPAVLTGLAAGFYLMIANWTGRRIKGVRRCLLGGLLPLLFIVLLKPRLGHDHTYALYDKKARLVAADYLASLKQNNAAAPAALDQYCMNALRHEARWNYYAVEFTRKEEIDTQGAPKSFLILFDRQTGKVEIEKSKFQETIDR